MAEPRAVEQDRADAAHDTVAAHGGRERCGGARGQRAGGMLGCMSSRISQRVAGTLRLWDAMTIAPCPGWKAPSSPPEVWALRVAHFWGVPHRTALACADRPRHSLAPLRDSDNDAVADAVFDQTRSDPGYEPNPGNKPGTGWDARFATKPK